MAARGQKRQLKQLKRNLHEMLKSLGEEDVEGFVLNIDEFQYLRRDFNSAAIKYEQSNSQLANASSKDQRSMLVYYVSDSKNNMDHCLRKMATIVTHMKNKKQKAESVAHKKQKNKQELEKLENQLQYKCLTLYHLQKTYFQLTKKEHSSASKPQNYPDIQTIEQLKLRKPLNRGFSQQSDHNSSSYLEQQELLEAIKQIDDRIEEKMDYILQGVKMMNYNAIQISQGIDTIHRKIMINVENINENLDELDRAQQLLDQASPSASKPNCIMNVIIVILLAIIVYMIVNIVIEADASNNDSLPTS